MRGTVKFFDARKGWGFVTTDSGEDYFVYHKGIVMEGFRKLDSGDIVDFEIVADDRGKTQAVNVRPVITRKMVEDALKEENLYLGINIDSNGVETFAVMDENNVLQTSEQGMTLLEVAAYVGINVEE